MRIIIIIFFQIFFLMVRSQNFVTPEIITTLTTALNENSGLINLNGEIWTHNDSGDENKLYQINLSNGSIIRSVTITDANNVDWEDISSDDTHIFVGDFGNNDGSRTNLRIYRVKRTDLSSSNEVTSKKINFSYSDQTSFEPNYHNTNFDCEAMASFQDHLYLFTKNWIDNQTKVYQLPKTSGTHIAQLLGSYNINCLVTGAEIMPAENELILAGYNTSGGSYTWIFSNFDEYNFFDGVATKLIWTTLTQIEGICSAGNHQVYISSEKIGSMLNSTLFFLDYSDYMTQEESIENHGLKIFTLQSSILIKSDNQQNMSGKISVYDLHGNSLIEKAIINENLIEVKINVPTGIYFLYFNSDQFIYTRKIFLAR